MKDKKDMKIIAFYLPQFHAIPENDEWWGKGFTEWTNVKKGVPLFQGHVQPKVPMNNQYYNLLDDNVKAWQISLAKENGIYGFCFYHYWFGGKLMLQKPLEQYLSNQTLDFPFCFCWANPEWTKIWAGEGSKVLIEQDYGDESQWEQHLQYLLPFFRDERYIKEDGKPLLVIYTPNEIPCLKEMIKYIRRRVKEEGFAGLALAYQYYVNEKEDKEIRPLFDYCIKFQPVYALQEIEGQYQKGKLLAALRKIDGIYQKLFKRTLSDFLKKVRCTEYDKVWECILVQKPEEKDIPGAVVDWDNTPRRGKAGRVFIGATPEKFKEYMKKLIKKAQNEYKTDYIFVTAWNEWSEGSYLEPDEKNGDAYLKAIKQAIAETRDNGEV